MSRDEVKNAASRAVSVIERLGLTRGQLEVCSCSPASLFPFPSSFFFPEFLRPIRRNVPGRLLRRPSNDTTRRHFVSFATVYRCNRRSIYAGNPNGARALSLLSCGGIQSFDHVVRGVLFWMLTTAAARFLFLLFLTFLIVHVLIVLP